MASTSQEELSNQQPDTPYASSDLSIAPLVSRPPFAPPPSAESLPSRPPVHSTAHSTSRPRGLSTVSTTSSVRRKPLPSTASPLATRCSSTDDRRDSVRSARTVTPYSIGSPTALEHPVPGTREVINGFKGGIAEEQNEQSEHKY